MLFQNHFFRNSRSFFHSSLQNNRPSFSDGFLFISLIYLFCKNIKTNYYDHINYRNRGKSYGIHSSIIFLKMKAKLNYSELSTEELLKKRKSSRSIMLAFGIIWCFIIIFVLYRYFTKGTMKFATIIPVFLPMITLLPIFTNLNELGKEIKSRNN